MQNHQPSSLCRKLFIKTRILWQTSRYSGGKDSLATLLVVIKAIGKVPMLFADTGMEFPETYANVEEASRHYGLDLIRTDGKTQFWEQFERQGPPAVNARWCCKVCKLTPVANLIREQWGECLSFIGQRRYESATRAQSNRVWRNSNVRTHSRPPRSTTGPLCMSGFILCASMHRTTSCMSVTWTGSDVSCARQAIWH